MASTPECEIKDGLDAAYIIGMVETGQQLFLCTEHGAHFGLTLALQTLDPAEIINAAQALHATPVPNGEETPAPTPARKRKSTHPQTGRARPKPEPRLPEEPATSGDSGDSRLQPGTAQP